MKKRPHRIFFVAQDMGGCNAQLPVMFRLHRKSGYKIEALFGPVCKEYIAPHLARYIAKSVDPEAEVARRLKAFRPDIIVVGISIGNSLDKGAVAWAKKHHIPCIGIVESWGDTVGGFSSPGTEDLDRIPDRICVLDDFLKRRMKKEGFDPSRIIVTGNPHFDSFAFPKKKHTGEKAVYFFCQPFSELPQLETGLDEVRVFRDLIQALERLKVDLPVIIRFHPRTKKRHKFDDIIANSQMRITIDRSKIMETALAKADLVLGMFGAALFEAALMGKKVLSYLPALTIPDPLMSNRIGLSVPVYRKRDLVSKMSKLIRSNRHEEILSDVRNKYVHGHATENVIHCIQSFL